MDASMLAIVGGLVAVFGGLLAVFSALHAQKTPRRGSDNAAHRPEHGGDGSDGDGGGGGD